MDRLIQTMREAVCFIEDVPRIMENVARTCFQERIICDTLHE